MWNLTGLPLITTTLEHGRSGGASPHVILVMVYIYKWSICYR